jgi:hypothetical protein
MFQLLFFFYVEKYDEISTIIYYLSRRLVESQGSKVAPLKKIIWICMANVTNFIKIKEVFELPKAIQYFKKMDGPSIVVLARILWQIVSAVEIILGYSRNAQKLTYLRTCS